MSKKAIDKKSALNFIVTSRENGKTDQDIYRELSLRYYDKKSLALLITATPRTENKNKYKIYNNVLLGLLVFVILLRILVVFRLTIETGQIWTLLFLFIVPFFAAYFAYEIAQYSAPFYRICGFMTIFSALRTIMKLESSTDILINLVLAVAIAGLSFYLDNKMFPDYSPQNLKKDSDGEYILS